MLEYVQQIDEQLLCLIHYKGQNVVLDTIMPFFRNPYFWAPVYLFLLVWLFINWKQKGFWLCVYLLATFAIADFTAASIIKPYVQRFRPCHVRHILFPIHELVTCGKGFSFPSAHAANHFGISVFLYFTIGKIYKWVKPMVLMWAALVCYAQLYVCVHYPSDIVAGAMLGTVIGYFFSTLFNKRYSNY